MGACVSDGSKQKPEFVNVAGQGGPVASPIGDGVCSSGPAMASQANQRASLLVTEPALPRIRVFTEVDADGGSDNRVDVSTFKGKYRMTPIVAFKPFATKQSRARAVKVIRNSYYRQGPAAGSTAAQSASPAGEAKAKNGSAKKPKESKFPFALDSCTDTEEGLSSAGGTSGSPRDRSLAALDEEKGCGNKPADEGLPVGRELASSKGIAGGSQSDNQLAAEAKPAPRLSREDLILLGSKRLKRRVDDMNLVEHQMRDDGNCQFRAIAHQIFGSQEYHELVRVHVVTYMKSVRDSFDCFLGTTEDADNYYAEMLKNGTWGDELTLRAASDSLHINIHILSSEEQNYYIAYNPSPDAPAPPAFLVDVSTMNQERQEALAAVAGTSAGSPLPTARSGGKKSLSATQLFGDKSMSSLMTKGLRPIHEEINVVELQREVQRKLATGTIRPTPLPVPEPLLPFKAVIEQNVVVSPPPPVQPKPETVEKPKSPRRSLEVQPAPPEISFNAKNTSVIFVCEKKKVRRKRRGRGRSKRRKGRVVGLPKRSSIRRPICFTFPPPTTRKKTRRAKSSSVGRKFPSKRTKRSEPKASSMPVARQFPVLLFTSTSSPLLPSPSPSSSSPPPSLSPSEPPCPHPATSAEPSGPTSFILVSPRSANSDMVRRLSLDNPSNALGGATLPLKVCEVSSLQGISGSLSDGEELEKCVLSGVPNAPIDIFLSYLSPVHYNALSMGGERLTHGVTPRAAG